MSARFANVLACATRRFMRVRDTGRRHYFRHVRCLAAIGQWSSSWTASFRETFHVFVTWCFLLTWFSRPLPAAAAGVIFGWRVKDIAMYIHTRTGKLRLVCIVCHQPVSTCSDCNPFLCNVVKAKRYVVVFRQDFGLVSTIPPTVMDALICATVQAMNRREAGISPTRERTTKTTKPLCYVFATYAFVLLSRLLVRTWDSPKAENMWACKM